MPLNSCARNTGLSHHTRILESLRFNLISLAVKCNDTTPGQTTCWAQCLTTLLPTVCIITDSQIRIRKWVPELTRSKNWERKPSRAPWWVPEELHQHQEVAQVRIIREAESGTVPSYHWLGSLSVAEKIANERCGRSTSASEGWVLTPVVPQMTLLSLWS